MLYRRFSCNRRNVFGESYDEGGIGEKGRRHLNDENEKEELRLIRYLE